MGADNLINFHKWQKWKDIFNDIAIVVFRRHGYNTKALKSHTSHIYKNYKIDRKNLSVDDFLKSKHEDKIFIAGLLWTQFIML